MRNAILLALIALAFPASAQPAPKPATAPTTRYVLVMPPGYEKVTVAGHTALAQSDDVEWVKKALAEAKPTTRPTTMPSDVLQRIAANRAAVVKQMVTDLALADDKETNKLFDDQILPTLNKLDQLKAPVFFLVCSTDQLRDLTKAGWGEPRFHYNKVANEPSYNENVRLSIDRPMDDTVLPVQYTDKDTPETKAKKVIAAVQDLDKALAGQLSVQSQPMVFTYIAEHIGKTVFDPLKLRRDQHWLGLGVTGYFASKYAGQLTPWTKADWLREMTWDPPRFPVSSKPIDLLHPTEESAMRPQAVPFYNQAMRCKATRVAVTWAEKAGEASMTKVIVAVRDNPPADGQALVNLIQQVAGIDVSKELAPQ
jgi:hypothetical protein